MNSVIFRNGQYESLLFLLLHNILPKLDLFSRTFKQNLFIIQKILQINGVIRYNRKKGSEVV